MNVVVKYDKDVDKALGALPRLVDPNAQLLEAPEHGHGHGHRHSGHDPGEVDGRVVREAMDRPGRHGDGVYGTPGPARSTGSNSAPPQRNVSTGQGSRSFGLGRRRALSMEASVHRFIRLLRGRGLRISVSEALDAMRCAAATGILADRELLREGPRLALVKDRRDEACFDEVFDAFFALIKVGASEHGHGHGHDDLSDGGELRDLTFSAEPSDTPEQGHSHGKPVDIRDYFDPEDLAQRYNLHQEANKIDLAALTDEIVFSSDQRGAPDDTGVQIEADRLSGAGVPGELSTATGTKIDAGLSVAQQEALLGWLNATEDALDDGSPGNTRAALRHRLTGVLANLPEAVKHHIERLLEREQRIVETGERDDRDAEIDRAGETERMQLEDSLRRLARTLHGALTPRRRTGTRGRVDPGRTMRRNMRYDGVPFSPVTVHRAEDKPRLVVLADVSLSVRATARFTLHLVHGLQSMFSQVRSFVFVADLVEISELFAEYPVERALGLVFGGDLLDVDANSHYGLAFGEFLELHASAVTRRTTVLVLGDGRGNGNEPNLDAFVEITRQARETIWLTPEPRYSWPLGRCDLPLYSEHCDRVRVVRDLSGWLARTLVAPGLLPPHAFEAAFVAVVTAAGEDADDPPGRRGKAHYQVRLTYLTLLRSLVIVAPIHGK